MLERWIDGQGKNGNSVAVEMGKVLLKNFGDISSEQPESKLSDLDKAVSEYKNDPSNPEKLTQFMSAFWQEAGQRIGKSYTVEAFPLTSKELKERKERGEMAISVPQGISRVDLGKMFPKMGSWSVEEGNSAKDIKDNFDCLWIESAVDAPNLNTTEAMLDEIAREKGKDGQSLRSYIIGAQISKVLVGKYFDEGATSSRLPGSRDGGRVLSASFDSGGSLSVGSYCFPGAHNGLLGGRFEEVVKA